MESNMKVTIPLSYRQTDCPHHLVTLHFNISVALSSMPPLACDSGCSPYREIHTKTLETAPPFEMYHRYGA